MALGRLPGTTKISEVMTANPKEVSVDETIENCLYLMREFGFRHLPIVDGKELRVWSLPATFCCATFPERKLSSAAWRWEADQLDGGRCVRE